MFLECCLSSFSLQSNQFIPSSLVSQACSQRLLFRLHYKIGLAICSQKTSSLLLACDAFDHSGLAWISFRNSFSQILENVSNLLCYIAIARGAKIRAKKCRNGLKVTRLFHWFVAQMLMVWWQRLCSHSGSLPRIPEKHCGKELEGS